jgi:2-iminobutanoate/2-iminopropanoate deaminase
MNVKWRHKRGKEIVFAKKAPVAIGSYSQAVKAGGFVFVSGQVPIDPATGELVGETVEEQTRQSLENIKAILTAAGVSLDKVVKVSVFIKNMDDFEAVNKIYSQYFAERFPARVCVQVAKLPLDAKLEIEAIALV